MKKPVKSTESATSQAAELRRRAEEMARKKAARSPKKPKAMSLEETRQTLHELRVHQIKLEMQNEELRRAQAVLQQSHDELEQLVTERTESLMRVNEELLESEEKHRLLVENSQDIIEKNPLSIQILDKDGFTLKVNPAHTKLFGSVPPPDYSLFNDPQLKQQGFGELIERIKNGEVVNFPDLPYNAHDSISSAPDVPIWIRVIAFPLNDSNAKPERFVFMHENITASKQAEAMLQQTEANFRRSLEELPLGVRILTAEGETIYVNQTILDIYGYDSVEELLTTPIKNRYTPQSYVDFKIRKRKRKKGDAAPSEYEISIIRKNGEIRKLHVFRKDIFWNGEKQFQVIYQDITERKRAEEALLIKTILLQKTRDMLIQIEKHAAIGRLAARIAHEILNPASIISSRLQFMEEENLSGSTRENVRVSREQIQRIVKISHDLFQSSVKEEMVLVEGDLRRVIEDGLQMTERRRKEDNVHVEYDPPSKIIPVKMERNRLVKVMVNLILNACEAMKGNREKRLIITVHYQEDSSNDYSIGLTVADNGQGIPAESINLIFEPFFTTKDPGQGSGLGLTISGNIIQDHGGTISTESNDMGGTSFIIRLPLDH
jgi:PAS domain S-box-containing protein